MEWSKFFLILGIVYGAWYLINVLIDLFFGGRGKAVGEEIITYDVTALIAEQPRPIIVGSEEPEEPKPATDNYVRNLAAKVQEGAAGLAEKAKREVDKVQMEVEGQGEYVHDVLEFAKRASKLSSSSIF